MKIDNQTLNYRISDRIRELISSGVVPAGTRLDERSLAEQLGVSRTPLREAIGKLAKEGLVEQRPYRGNFVRVFTTQQVNDLYEVRKNLEGLAARLAVSRLPDEGLGRLRVILDDVQAAVERRDMAAFADADQRFHDAIARASGNGTLLEALDRLRLQIQLVRVVANRDPGVVERTAHERPQILAALEARDGNRAARLMEEHIEGVRRSVVAQLESLEHAEASADRPGKEMIEVAD